MNRVPLPIDSSLPQIVAQLTRAKAMVIVAPPGAGKTTRVPVALIAGKVVEGEHRNIVMLQPRRVAARASAARIADENGWEIGREVGYHVRFDRKIGRDTRLRVVTEGILARQLLEDPFLEGTGAVILDEFHERSLHSDMAIALLREVQETVRPDLKIVVMSATLEAGPVAKFLGNCPVVHTQGRVYPVDIEHVNVVRGREVEGAVAAVERIVSAQTATSAPPMQKDILIFMPGAEEIRRTIRDLEPLALRQSITLLPLHGTLTSEEQDRVLRPDPQGRQKVIVATNIAETSLTIEGVGVVIDSGLARVASYDAERGLDRLDVERISRASATQRSGRAGRTGPGRCVRLWSEKEWERMDAFETPEIKRVDLCGTVLELAAWGKADPRLFGWFEAPESAMLEGARGLLAMLGTIDAKGAITPVGRAVARLPVHPRLGRLLVEATLRDMLRTGATLAALISEKDILRETRLERGSMLAGMHRVAAASDLIVRMHLLEENARDERLDRQAVKQVLRVREELIRMGERISTKAERSGFRVERSNQSAIDSGLSTHDSALLQLILWAYPDRVCRRRGGKDRGVMVGGGGVRIAEESAVTQGEYFVAVDARHDTRSLSREALVRIASGVEIDWLEQMFPGQIRRERQVEYDEQRQRIVCCVRLFYLDLLLKEDKDAPVDPAMAREMLGEVVRKRAGELFRENEAAANVIQRMNLLQKHMPEQNWPAWDDAELGEILASNLGAAKSLAAVRQSPLAHILKSSLVYPLDRLFEKETPESMEVPSGSRISLRYGGGEVVLAVRLQELFGLLDTPRVAGGRVPVKLELLAPNYRPVQVTSDLRSFWTNTYFQVKKDLKARYPKHSWPDDPLTARAECKGGRRRN